MLARHPDNYHVTILERDNKAGGQSSSIPVDQSKYGADWVNSVAQFASPNSPHAFKFFRAYGYEPQAQQYQLALGKGKENFFTNVFSTPVLQRHSEEIRRLSRGFKSIKRAPRVFSYIPLQTYLRLFRYSNEFAERIIYPLAAALIPIGNHGNDIPVGLAQWLFARGRRNIWDYDAKSGLPNISNVYTFPNMGQFYQDWAEGLCAKGVKIRLNTRVLNIHQRDHKGVVVETRTIEADWRLEEEGCRDRIITEVYDKLVLCVHADEAKRILGSEATWMEKIVLGGVKFSDALNVIHSDSAYFQRKYDVMFKDELCAEPRTEEEEERIKFAKGETGVNSGFRPSYCTFSYPSRSDKVEVAFDSSNLQHQFRPTPGSNEGEPPLDRHIYQSHFMIEELKHLWTVDQIDDDHIIDRRWWHTPIHTWKHYAKIVRLMKHINGKRNTVYAGAWTLVVSRCFPLPQIALFVNNCPYSGRTLMNSLVYRVSRQRTVLVHRTKDLTRSPKAHSANICGNVTVCGTKGGTEKQKAVRGRMNDEPHTVSIET